MAASVVEGSSCENGEIWVMHVLTSKHYSIARYVASHESRNHFKVLAPSEATHLKRRFAETLYHSRRKS